MKPSKITYTSQDRVLNFIRGAARSGLSSHERFTYADAVDLLDDLFRVERENAAIDIRLRINDGAMIVYQGIARALLFQTQRHVRLALWRRGDDFEANVKYLLERNSELGGEAHQEDYDQWRLNREGLSRFLQHLESLPRPERGEDVTRSIPNHPRNFSVEDRRAAWADFEASGNFCPGQDRPKHKVNIAKGDRIEYDHLLPYAKGGQSTYNNLRILCGDCNRRKGSKIS